MKESFFERLFSYRESQSISPRENFLTEIFAYVLEIDRMVRESFFKKIGVESLEGSFQVLTQNSYAGFGRPDIEVLMKDCQILIENKVEHEERLNQLTDYANILSYCKSKQKILVYLTRYFESKEVHNSEIQFHSLRWHEIYPLLEKSSNPIAQELGKYLNEQGMSQSKNFSSHDLATFQTMSATISKMEEVLNSVRPYFEGKFGSLSKKSARSTRLKSGCFADLKEFWLPEKAFQLDYGFCWWWNDGHTYLMFRIWLPESVERNKDRVLAFKQSLELDWDPPFEEEKGTFFQKVRKITEFFSETDQIPEMIKFFKNAIDDFFICWQSNIVLFSDFQKSKETEVNIED